MKFRVLRFIYYCLWIAGVAGGILIFLSPVVTVLYARLAFPLASFESPDLLRLLLSFLLSALAGVLFALPLLAVAELIGLGLAIEEHTAASRQSNERMVALLEQIAANSRRPAAPVAAPAPAPAVNRPPAAKPAAPVASQPPAPKKPTPAASQTPASRQTAPAAPPPEPVIAAAAAAPAVSPAPVEPTPAPVTTLTAEVTAQNAFVFEQPDVRAKYLGSTQQGRTLKVYGRDETGQWFCADSTGVKWIQAIHVAVAGDASALPVMAPPSGA